ncbi:hypothetical protein Dda_6444 [Drechslerella dactyloides]|uniref:glycogenin glucosyltransferase n=1 Tax=Drechslerella dactyloides TaxID=74499 RepID=A0AAD6ITL2_DREDA|nr:hypothetical protein Dda_6444 [Drechslerella dactyloides]
MEGEEVYCTMLLTDGYLPGAQVLAHSLRDGGATRKLAVLATADSLSAATMAELHRLYDYVIPVDRIVNRAHGNLALMGRMDLSSAFTKIHLWRQTQFSRIVYLDADAVALRAPEELFATTERIAGVMVVKPDLGTFYALQNLAGRGVSFDGADQGLLNQYFQRWHRLSFVYNVTPSAHYQYVPAYQHYRANIVVAHFIGANKPWVVGRGNGDSSAYGEMLGRWWAAWDAHYRPLSEQDPAAGWGQRARTGRPTEYDPDFRREHGAWDDRQQHVAWRPPSPKRHDHHHHHIEQQTHHHHHHDTAPPPVFLPKEHVPYVPREMPYDAYSQTQHHHHQQHHVHSPQPVHHHNAHWHDGRRYPEEIPHRLENGLPLPPFEPPLQPWDAGRFSPPPDSKPEASNWPVQAYENTWGTAAQDTALFVPPAQYAQQSRPAPIFPWEQRAVPKPTRVFADEPKPKPEPAPTPLEETELETVDDEFETEEAEMDVDAATGMLGFDSYSRSNAWDSIPAIEEYVATFTKGRSGAPSGKKGDVTPNPAFRTALAILPPEISVTPTPFKAMRRGYRSSAMDDESKFPSAKGIPDQQHWDPFKSLEELKNAPGELLSKRSPPSPQTMSAGSPGSGSGTVAVLVSSSMPVPEREWHITAFQRRHEREASLSSSGGGDGSSSTEVWKPLARRYQSSATQTEGVETSDAETQSDGEEIDAEMGA